MSKTVVLTGGGTAGHVTPNLAIIPKLKELGFDIEYIGTKNGMEREIIEGDGRAVSYYLCRQIKALFQHQKFYGSG